MTERPEVSEFGSVDPAPPTSNSVNLEKLRDILCDEDEKMFQRMRALFALRNIVINYFTNSQTNLNTENFPELS